MSSHLLFREKLKYRCLQKWWDGVYPLLEKNGIEFRFTDKETILYPNGQNFEVSGYFVDRPELILGIATGGSEELWMTTFIHEISHAMQWIEKSPVWMKIFKDGREAVDYIDEWVNGVEHDTGTLSWAFEQAKNVEMDCEKRVVSVLEKIKKELGPSEEFLFDVRRYCKNANAYVHSYDWVRENRKWPDVGAYKMPSILAVTPDQLSDQMPESFFEAMDEAYNPIRWEEICAYLMSEYPLSYRSPHDVSYELFHRDYAAINHPDEEKRFLFFGMLKDSGYYPESKAEREKFWQNVLEGNVLLPEDDFILSDQDKHETLNNKIKASLERNRRLHIQQHLKDLSQPEYASETLNYSHLISSMSLRHIKTLLSPDFLSPVRQSLLERQERWPKDWLMACYIYIEKLKNDLNQLKRDFSTFVKLDENGKSREILMENIALLSKIEDLIVKDLYGQTREERAEFLKELVEDIVSSSGGDENSPKIKI